MTRLQKKKKKNFLCKKSFSANLFIIYIIMYILHYIGTVDMNIMVNVLVTGDFLVKKCQGFEII